MISPNHTKSHSEFEHWQNYETSRVDKLLSHDTIWPLVEQFIHDWEDERGLGVELADALHDLMRVRLSAYLWRPVVWLMLRNVNWNQLAEQYALEVVGVTEAELTRRREDFLQ